MRRPRQQAAQRSEAGAASPIDAWGGDGNGMPRASAFAGMRQMVMRANRQRIEELRAWWLDRMVHSPRPLEEKLTLFWHGHFATQALKVKFPQVIYAQNELLRRNASGSFRDLVLGISRDPAMLIYLDNNRNRREHPNENYARELMELFTLGIGHYTEEDVKEAARAFTGWTMALDGDRASGNPGPMALLRVAAGSAKPAYTFRPRWHDEGEKQFLGHHGSAQWRRHRAHHPRATRLRRVRLWQAGPLLCWGGSSPSGAGRRPGADDAAERLPAPARPGSALPLQ